MRPSCAFISHPLEGVGNAGCPLHPQPRVQCVGSTRVSSPRSHRDHPAFPHAMVLTASFVLSPVTGLVCHRHQRMLAVSVRSNRHASANLTPASGRQDHTTSPSAAIVSRPHALCRSRIHENPPCNLSRARRCRVHRIPCPTSVTIAIRPSVGRDTKSSRCDLGQREQVFFGKSERKDSTTLSTNRPTGKSLEPVLLSAAVDPGWSQRARIRATRWLHPDLRWSPTTLQEATSPPPNHNTSAGSVEPSKP